MLFRSMRPSFGRDLRQVRNRNHLHLLPEVLHDISHFVGDFARYAHIDLVEDDGRQRGKTGNHGFDAQHQAGDFTARSRLRYRFECFVLIGREEEADLVHPVGRQSKIEENAKFMMSKLATTKSIDDFFLFSEAYTIIIIGTSDSILFMRCP